MPGESIWDLVARGITRARKIIRTAQERETQHYLAEGWSLDTEGKWHLPDGRPATGNVFDGPSSHVSLFHFIEQVCKEEGIDLSSVRTAVETILEHDGHGQ